MTRAIELAKELGATKVMGPAKYENLGLLGNDLIEAFYQRAYQEGYVNALTNETAARDIAVWRARREGQAAMRERAARECEGACPHPDQIRNLEIE